MYEREPIYEGGYSGYWVKDLSGNVIYKTMDPNDIMEYTDALLAEGNADWTWGKGLEAELVGYREVCVQEEQGHWEYR